MNERNLSCFVKRERLKKRLDQAEFAKLCDLSQSVLSRIEAGKIQRPTLETLNKIATALSVESAELERLIVNTIKNGALINTLDLVKSIYQCDLNFLSEGEFLFLLDMYRLVKNPIPAELIKEILLIKRGDSETPKDVDFEI